jgi:hypothetical protein
MIGTWLIARCRWAGVNRDAMPEGWSGGTAQTREIVAEMQTTNQRDP